MRVVFQIGYKKYSNRKREGQKIVVYVDDEECEFSDGCGKYLTSYHDSLKKGFCWFMYEVDAESTSTIRIDVKTSSGGVTDERRTFEAYYSLNAESPVREVNINGVGMAGYPLIKGRVLEIASLSEEDKRKSEIDDFMNQDF